MKILCSCCKKILTEDLYPVNHKNHNKIFNKQNEYFHGESVKKGIFVLTKSEPAYSWTDIDVYGDFTDDYTGFHLVIKKVRPRIIVSKNSVINGVIPLNPINCCCNWSCKPLICECGNEVGIMNLDCYEDGAIRFDLKSVIRSYL